MWLFILNAVKLSAFPGLFSRIIIFFYLQDILYKDKDVVFTPCYAIVAFGSEVLWPP